jgi:ethanolamine ammonia-lyase small subunit
LPAIILRTCANDRIAYLKDPDLGRRLADESGRSLAELAAAGGPPAVAIIVSDGLSALAAERHAVGLATELYARMGRGGQSAAPVAVVPLARVAVEDEIGEALRAEVAVILLGERPGLGTADSLGAYLVYGPRRGRTDAERNCVSNIRVGGLDPRAAAETITWMIEQMLRRRVSGVALKDDRVLGREEPLGSPKKL